MAEELKIPPFGESIVTANVSRWHKADGDSVKKGETLVTLETDKVSQDLDAPVDGVLKIQVEEDEEVEIGAVIATIDDSAAAPSSSEEKPAESAPAQEPAAQSTEGAGEVVPVKIPPFGESIQTASVSSWAVSNGQTVSKGQALVTLETDKVSQDLEAEADGTIEILVAEGEEVAIGATIGKLTKGAAPAQAAPEKTAAPSESKKETPKAAESKPAPAAPVEKAPDKRDPAKEGKVTRRKMSMLRRKIAQHLVNAQQTAAILTTFNEVDMTNVMALRKEVQEDFVSKHGVKLGFMSLFVKAVVSALKEVPAIGYFIEENEIVENHFYDIGVAVGTEKGLVVPVIRECDEKGFADIEKSIADSAKKAREGALQLEDLQGGIFTISNGGVYGSLLSTPILNPPQSGILGMHTIQQRPVAVDGKVEIRPMMYLALSYDHRIVDGKEAVTFLINIKNSLENPARLLLEC
ncbi:MAG: dihydrolipoyllysine-residue succinyltransferase [Verrucomicrobiota bacterium JB023]|nr:dihydrolipoyllysine-residue succinyltransferase [Verrucomicrobiota bacterium JB023]